MSQKGDRKLFGLRKTDEYLKQNKKRHTKNHNTIKLIHVVSRGKHSQSCTSKARKAGCCQFQKGWLTSNDIISLKPG